MTGIPWSETKMAKRKIELAKIRDDHLLCTHSGSRSGGIIVNRAGCSCGATFGWYRREEEHADHLDAVVIEHFEAKVDDLKKRIEAIRQAAEYADDEDGMETGADYYYEPVVPLSKLKSLLA